MPSQPEPGGAEDVFTAIRRNDRHAALHHRLDRGASGLLLLAVHPDANRPISEMFKTHALDRVYLAVLVGEAAGGVWDRPLDGKPARTEVEALGRGQGMTAVRLRLHTGRTHQIRRHAAMAGRPVAGDRRYGGEAGRRWGRLALHAARLGFVHPVLGTPCVFDSPIPDDLAEIWSASGASGRLPG